MENEQINLNNICRTCKNKSPEMKSLYHWDSESGKENLRLDEMLMTCTTVQVNNEDDLPKIICQTCFVQLKNSYRFKEQCEKTDVFLRDYLKKLNRAVTKEKVPLDEGEYHPNAIADNESTTNYTNNDKDVTEHIRDDPESESGESRNKDVDCVQVSFMHNNLLRSLLNGAFTKEKVHSDKGEHPSNVIATNESLLNNTNNYEDVTENIRDKPELQSGASGYKDADYVQVFRDLTIYQCRTCSKKFYTIEDLRNHKKVQHYTQLDVDDKMGGFSMQSDEKEDEVEGEGLDMGDDIIEPKIEVLEDNSQDKIDEIAQITNEICTEENLPQMFVDVGAFEDEMHKEYEEFEGGTNIDADNGIEYKSEGNADSEYLWREAPSTNSPREHQAGTHECETCNKKFNTSDSLRRHKRSHLDVKPYRCAICKRTFARKDTLNGHMKVHADGPREQPPRIHECDICNRKFNRVDSLRRHKQWHLDVKSKVCVICKKRFARKCNLTTHMKVHGGTYTYKCDVCDMVFNKEDILVRHKAYKHNIGKKITVKEKKFKCEYCEKGFTAEMYRDTHMKNHFADKKFQCSICEKTFTIKRYYKEHMKIHDGSLKKFLCTECGKGFLRNDHLLLHMMRHRGEKPFKCKFCGKGFVRKMDVTVHERCHTGEKSHLCVTCGKGFVKLSDLQMHMRTHTGEKPYRCTYCDAAFARCNDMKVHVRRHTGERLQCELCPKTFLRTYTLMQHKRDVHGLNIVSINRRLQRVNELNPDDPQPITAPSPTPVVASDIPSDHVKVEEGDIAELKQE